jgi:hypothetical protein
MAELWHLSYPCDFFQSASSADEMDHLLRKLKRMKYVKGAQVASQNMVFSRIFILILNDVRVSLYIY